MLVLSTTTRLRGFLRFTDEKKNPTGRQSPRRPGGKEPAAGPPPRRRRPPPRPVISTRFNRDAAARSRRGPRGRSWLLELLSLPRGRGRGGAARVPRSRYIKGCRTRGAVGRSVPSGAERSPLL